MEINPTTIITLPDFIDLNGDWEEVKARLYAVFTDTFKPAPLPYLFGKPVAYDKRCLGDDRFEEGFWHVISRDTSPKKDRIFDPERARRLPWIKLMLWSTPIQWPTQHQLTRFKYKEGNGTVKYYLWLKNDNYVVIFAERKTVMILVTAFFIDKEWLKNDLEKRHSKATLF